MGLMDVLRVTFALPMVLFKGSPWDSRAFKKRASMKEAVTDPKPKPYKAVRVWLPDGTRMLGMWTGTKWWSVNREIKPVKWELEERKKKKTKELMRALPKFG
jgi:hypothetical protein